MSHTAGWCAAPGQSCPGVPKHGTCAAPYNDKAFAQQQLPPLVKVRWGHIRLRPHWVPRVPAEVVKGWRAAGKPAPRKYDAAKHGGG